MESRTSWECNSVWWSHCCAEWWEVASSGIVPSPWATLHAPFVCSFATLTSSSYAWLVHLPSVWMRWQNYDVTIGLLVGPVLRWYAALIVVSWGYIACLWHVFSARVCLCGRLSDPGSRTLLQVALLLTEVCIFFTNLLHALVNLRLGTH